jgi:hypothetical protein
MSEDRVIYDLLGALPVVDVARLAEAIEAGMILRHLAERSAE